MRMHETYRLESLGTIRCRPDRGHAPGSLDMSSSKSEQTVPRRRPSCIAMGWIALLAMMRKITKTTALAYGLLLARCVNLTCVTRVAQRTHESCEVVARHPTLWKSVVCVPRTHCDTYESWDTLYQVGFKHTGLITHTMTTNPVRKTARSRLS